MRRQENFVDMKAFFFFLFCVTNGQAGLIRNAIDSRCSRARSRLIRRTCNLIQYDNSTPAPTVSFHPTISPKPTATPTSSNPTPEPTNYPTQVSAFCDPVTMRDLTEYEVKGKKPKKTDLELIEDALVARKNKDLEEIDDFASLSGASFYSECSSETTTTSGYTVTRGMQITVKFEKSIWNPVLFFGYGDITTIEGLFLLFETEVDLIHGGSQQTDWTVEADGSGSTLYVNSTFGETPLHSGVVRMIGEMDSFTFTTTAALPMFTVAWND